MSNRRRMKGRLCSFAATLTWAIGLCTAWCSTPAAAADALVATAASTAPASHTARPAPLLDERLLSPDFARIRQRGELIVAMLGADTPPFFFRRDGQWQGFDVDLAREIAAGIGVPLRIDDSPASFNEVVERVALRQADLGISKISRTATRAQAVQFSQPYLTLHHGLLVNRLAFARLAQERDAQQVLRSFNGTLGVIAQSSFADFAGRSFPNAQLRAYGSWGEVVQAVQGGQVVAAYRDELEVKRVLIENRKAALTLRTVTLTDLRDTLGVAVRADAPLLLSYVNFTLETRPTRLSVSDVLARLDPLRPKPVAGQAMAIPAGTAATQVRP